MFLSFQLVFHCMSFVLEEILKTLFGFEALRNSELNNRHLSLRQFFTFDDIMIKICYLLQI